MCAVCMSRFPAVRRCGMNPSSLYEMRHSIVQAVSDYVDIEAEELVEVGSLHVAYNRCHLSGGVIYLSS